MSLRVSRKLTPDQLHRLAVDLGEATSPAEVARRLARTVAPWPGVARVRVWYPGPGDACSSCAERDRCSHRERCLHLAASGGISQSVPTFDGTRVDGPGRRLPLELAPIGTVFTEATARDGAPRGDLPGLGDAEWLENESVRGYGAAPIPGEEGPRGVIAVATRLPFGPEARALLAGLAEQAGNALRGVDRLAALDRARREAEARHALLEPPAPAPLLGESTAFRHVRERLRLLAASDVAVLVVGEPGTGRTRIAEEIHRTGPQREGPCLRVDARDPRAETHLFGTAGRPTAFALAAGGTLLLDDVDRFPVPLQARIAERLDAPDSPRVVASTSRAPDEALREGAWHPALHDRLAVFPLPLPPLRERGDDVLLLLEAFLAEEATRLGVAVPDAGPRLRARFLRPAWPGNLRQLRAVIAAGLDPTGGFHPTLPGAEIAEDDPGIRTARDLRDLERENLRRALEAAGGKVSGPGGAAELLGAPASTVASRVKALGLAPKRPRS